MLNSLELALENYLRAKRPDVKPVTLHNKEMRVGRFVKFCVRAGCASPTDITREHFTRYRETWKYADITAKQHITAIRAFLKDCDREDLARKLPKPKLTGEGGARRKPRPFSDDEIAHSWQ